MRKMPHSVQFDDMQLTFRLSDDLLERTLFEEWQGMVFDDTWGNLGYLDEYGGVVEIKKTSRRGSGSTVAKYVLHDAWPISVGQVDVGDENGEISVVNVGFAYRHWTRE